MLTANSCDLRGVLLVNEMQELGTVVLGLILGLLIPIATAASIGLTPAVPNPPTPPLASWWAGI